MNEQMNKREIIQKTKDYVKAAMKNEEVGHDWWHIYRVWKMARRIGREEKADMFIVELGALLHDIADWKFHAQDAGPKKARAWLQALDVDKKSIDHVVEIIENISFKGSAEKDKMRTTEGKVVQDADRLDALGAIGISRVFVFAGHKGNPIFDPRIKPKRKMKFSEYKKSNRPAITHFYEKLLLLKGRMNTSTGRRIAESRHVFMEQYLDEFFKEWSGER